MPVDRLNLRNEMELEELREFLKEGDIDYEESDGTYVIREKGKIIGTGSYQGKIMKYFYIDPSYKGQGLMGKIYERLLSDMFEKSYKNHFVFTRPENKILFSSLGLTSLAETDKVLLLEGGFSNYKNFINQIKKDLSGEDLGAIVMNLNPMTIGHKYLIEKALEEVDELIIFVVEEDLSLFPFESRIKIVKDHYKDQDRVKIYPSGPYIISRTTFPTYFLKEETNLLEEYTKIDGIIFRDKIGKDLNIRKRFLGSEPLDRVTAEYNKNLEEIFKDSAIELRIIDRIKSQDQYISASQVRKMLKEGDSRWEDLVVEEVKELIESEEGKKILKRL